MRLNKTTYPIWDYIENADSKEKLVHMPVDDMFIKQMATSREELFEYMDGFQKTVQQRRQTYYVTQPFQDALVKALPKIETKYTEVDPEADCGVIITKQGLTVYMTAPGDSDLRIILYGFSRDAHTCFAIMNKDKRVAGSYIVMEDGVARSDQNMMAKWCNNVLALLYFINNCETEQMPMKPGEKKRTTGRHAEKHFNESNSPVTILGCDWFTEFVQVNEANVGGHFRWQPIGPRAEKKVKLIYIAEFKKGAYKRRAKKDILNKPNTDTMNKNEQSPQEKKAERQEAEPMQSPGVSPAGQTPGETQANVVEQAAASDPSRPAQDDETGE